MIEEVIEEVIEEAPVNDDEITESAIDDTLVLEEI